jgi:type II secretory pathway pseudopilin PulG
MLVVIALILLVAGMAMPTIAQLFRSGADAQAYNLVSAQINATRTYAMQNNCFACLHLQVATGPGSSDPQTTVGVIFVWNPTISKFGLTNPTTGQPTGFDPQSYPGNYAFGQASAAFINIGNTTTNTYLSQVANVGGGCDFNPANTTAVADKRTLNIAAPWFTSVNIIFTPLGDITTTINGQTSFLFDTTSAAFYTQTAGVAPAGQGVWEAGTANSRWTNSLQTNGFSAVNALTMFSMTDANNSYKTSPNDFLSFINQSGQLIPINVYTAQLFPRR